MSRFPGLARDLFHRRSFQTGVEAPAAFASAGRGYEPCRRYSALDSLSLKNSEKNQPINGARHAPNMG